MTEVIIASAAAGPCLARGVLESPTMTKLPTLLLLTLASAARADGGCETRDIRPAERRAYERVLAAIQAAVPPVPKGWQVRSEDSFDAPETVCVGAEKSPLVIGWQRTLEMDDEERAKRDQEGLGKAKAINAKMNAKATANKDKIGAIDKRIDELTKQMQALAEKGDFAKMEKLTAEIEKLSAQKAGAMGAPEAEADVQAAQNAYNDDAELVISVTANMPSVLVGTGMERFEVKGATHAFQWTAEYKGAAHTDAFAFLGNYSGIKKESGSTIKYFSEKGLPYTGVHAFVVSASGKKERAVATLKAMALGKLGALVYKDLGKD